MFPPEALIPLLALLKACVWGIMGPLGDRVRKAPSMWLPAGRLIPEPVVVLIQAWLQKRRQMIEALVQRIAAGTHVARLYKPREPRPDASPEPRTEIPPEKRLPPRTFGWINGLASEVNCHGNGLGHLVTLPEMRAMILASPQLARLWVPLLNAMGQTKPDWWPKPPPRPRRARKARLLPRAEKPGIAGPDPTMPFNPSSPPPWQAPAVLRLPADTPSPHRPLGVWDNHWVRPSTRRLGEF